MARIARSKVERKALLSSSYKVSTDMDGDVSLEGSRRI